MPMIDRFVDLVILGRSGRIGLVGTDGYDIASIDATPHAKLNVESTAGRRRGGTCHAVDFPRRVECNHC